MNSINVKKIEIIVNDLLSEFDKESSKLQSEYDDNVVRILEIEENIHNYKENEDVDFQVFSPRKIDNQNEEKIEAMNLEKESIEEINKSPSGFYFRTYILRFFRITILFIIIDNLIIIFKYFLINLSNIVNFRRNRRY